MLLGMFGENNVEMPPDYSPVPIDEIKINNSKRKTSPSLVRVEIGTGPGGCGIYYGREWEKTQKGESRQTEVVFIATKSGLEGRGESWQEAVENLNVELLREQQQENN